MISDFYQLSLNKETYGIKGYYVAKTTNYSSRECVFSKSKRRDLSYEAQAHSKEPDPTKYNESYEKNMQRHWLKPNGKFLKAKKKTIMDDVANQSKSTPGPGQYLKDTKSLKTNNKGAFSKGERLNYLSSVEWYSGETPCSWKYSPSPIKPRNKGGWRKPSSAKKITKVDLGPGKYEDGLKVAYKRTMSAVISHSFSKVKDKGGAIYQRAKDTSFVPGVGAYVNAERAYSSNAVLRKSRTPVILPYKAKGFTDDLVKRGKETPGPGSYYIGPPIKKK